MTREHFTVQLGRLIVLRNWPDDDSEWWTALGDIDAAVFEAACSHALKTRVFFPLPAELREDCDAVKARIPHEAVPSHDVDVDPFVLELKNPLPEGGPSLRIRISREWRHDCDTCGDTGWASRRCPDTHCGRRVKHEPHEFVEPCLCLDWNPTIKRRKEAAQKYAAEKAA